MSAEVLKAEGNAAFAAKDFKKAAKLFTEAIEASPTPNHVLYSNRSGAFASMREYAKALEDANACINIKPDWVKGYTRKGAACHGLGDLVSAAEAYDKALELDPSNAQAQQGKKSVEEAVQREAARDNIDADMGFSKMLNDPSTISKLYQHPKTREYLKDPTFMQNLKLFAANPSMAINGMVKDPRVMEAFSVLLGIDPSMTAGPQDTEMSGETEPSSSPKPTATGAAGAPPKKTSEPDTASQKRESPVSEEKERADKEKALGNECYKRHEFDDAIAHYNNAWEICRDITYLNNRAAAEYEKGDLEEAIKTCHEAVEAGKEMHADYKLIAKAYGRIGTCYLKQDKLQEAIPFFEKSLTEHRSPDVLTKLRSTQRELRRREEQSYLDPVKAEEARERGNEFFKKGELPEAVKEYTESIKRAPKDPRGYGNRAAAFLKLMNYPDVVSDCDKAIELDSNFFKAYTRKATALNIMKQYRKAMDTLEEARKIDTEMKHFREIEDLYQKAMSGRFAYVAGETEEQRAERLSKDPEIDEIRRDPVMNTILQQAANDPAALRDHMNNPEVRRKINLLAAAGIIRTR